MKETPCWSKPCAVKVMTLAMTCMEFYCKWNVKYCLWTNRHGQIKHCYNIFLARKPWSLLEDTDGETTFMVLCANLIIGCLCWWWWIGGRGERLRDRRAFQIVVQCVFVMMKNDLCPKSEGEEFWEELWDILGW